MGGRENRDYAIIAVAVCNTSSLSVILLEPIYRRRGILMVAFFIGLTVRILTDYYTIPRHDEESLNSRLRGKDEQVLLK